MLLPLIIAVLLTTTSPMIVSKCIDDFYCLIVYSKLIQVKGQESMLIKLMLRIRLSHHMVPNLCSSISCLPSCLLELLSLL